MPATTTTGMPERMGPVLLRVSGHSMEPALRPGDLLLALPLRGRRGDLVVLDRPSGVRYVKRVAAVAGDVVELEAGRLRVNGRPLDGRPRVAGPVVGSWTVPPGAVFVAGDNPLASADSRTWPDPFVPAGSTRRVLRVSPGGWGAAGVEGFRRQPGTPRLKGMSAGRP